MFTFRSPLKIAFNPGRRSIHYAVMNLSLEAIPPTGSKHTASVIFFHGSGDTGSNLMEYVQSVGRLKFPHIKTLFPTAPLQPYTPSNGEKLNVWFDRKAISIDAEEDKWTLTSIYTSVSSLVSSEIVSGIPPSRIVVGGFSMGGAMALHTAFHLIPALAGVFVFSAFLNRKSIVYESLKKRGTSNLPKLLMSHGASDQIVPGDWGKETFQELKKLGVKGDFSVVPNASHDITEAQMRRLETWLRQVLPEKIQ